MSEASRRIIEEVQRNWRPFRDAVDRLDESRLEEQTPAGWSAKEMLATVAFWDEAAPGWITMGIRGQPLPAGFKFGSGFESGPSWPPFDEHNSREAAWGAGHSAREVLQRLDDAHEKLLAMLATVTEVEEAANKDYFRGLAAHYPDHQPELEALLATEGPSQ
jgi:hypothetical protein